jgi:Na+-translocating ferredoxin:NAD+ oxidoreductase RnfG subunit
MKKEIILLIATAVLSMLLFSFGLPKNVEKRVHKEIEKTFELSDFSMQSIRVSEELKKKLPAKFTTTNFFKLLNNEVLIGYVFVDQAPSKTAKFDYLVIFDKDLKVKHSKVLIYREEYGGEIGSKRWLKQFLGLTAGDRVDHETNIDGIAGATISVRSMTKAIDDLLQSIAVLKENKVL